MKTVRTLILLHENFEEIEAVTPIDLLRRAGIEVTVASVETSLKVKGRSGLIVEAETLLPSVQNETFACVILPGGPGIQKVRSNKAVLSIIDHQAKSKRWVAAICAAPLLLNDLNLLQNHPFTAYSGALETLNAPKHKEEVIVSHPLITSKGPGTAMEFSLSIISELLGKDAAKKIVESIEYTPKS